MDFSNILPCNLEPEYAYTEEELREIESKDRANLCEDGPDGLEQQQECVCLKCCFVYRLSHTYGQVSDNSSA